MGGAGRILECLTGKDKITLKRVLIAIRLSKVLLVRSHLGLRKRLETEGKVVLVIRGLRTWLNWVQCVVEGRTCR